MNTYTLLETPIFVGFVAEKQIWQISAILPSGTESFVIGIDVNLELNIHQAICDRINGSSPTIGSDPVDGTQINNVPPPSLVLELLALIPGDDFFPLPTYPTINADIYNSIVLISPTKVIKG